MPDGDAVRRLRVYEYGVPPAGPRQPPIVNRDLALEVMRRRVDLWNDLVAREHAHREEHGREAERGERRAEHAAQAGPGPELVRRRPSGPCGLRARRGHSYASRKRRTTASLARLIASVSAKSRSPTANRLWYSTVPAGVSPRLTWAM